MNAAGNGDHSQGSSSSTYTCTIFLQKFSSSPPPCNSQYHCQLRLSGTTAMNRCVVQKYISASRMPLFIFPWHACLVAGCRCSLLSIQAQLLSHLVGSHRSWFLPWELLRGGLIVGWLILQVEVLQENCRRSIESKPAFG